MKLKSILLGILLSYMITFPIFVIFAIVLTYTSFPERFISPLVLIATISSILMAGTIATRKLKSKGWLNGGVVGFFYMLVLYLLSSIIFQDFTINGHVITMVIIGLLTGSIGGIIGINFQRPSRVRVRSMKK